MTIQNDPLLEDMFKKFGASTAHYDPMYDAYSTNLLRIHNNNVNDIMHHNGLFKPYFDLVNFLHIYNITECVSSTSFPQRCRTVDLNSLCNFQKFDGDDCKLGNYHSFESDFIASTPYLSIANCNNLDSVVNVNSNGDACNLTLRDNDSLKRIHAHHRVISLHLLNCKSINDFSQIELREVAFACINNTRIRSFSNCNTVFDELDFSCDHGFDFAEAKNLKIQNKLTLSHVRSHNNILELLNCLIPRIVLSDISYACKILNRYLDHNNILIHKRPEFIMDCMLEFIDAGITDVS